MTTAMVNKRRETPIIVVKKKVGRRGYHGGAWKVALADFMTVMFALFLVLWLVNQSSDVKAAIAGYFQDPLGRADDFGSSLVKGEGVQTPNGVPLGPIHIINLRIDRLQQLARQLRAKLGETPLLDSLKQHVAISMMEAGVRIELLEDSTAMFFQSGSAVPSERGRRLIELIGRELARDSSQILIEGHTDARPYVSGAGYTNWELSSDRANAARRILNDTGVAFNRIEEIRGLADRELRYPNAPFDPRNRRVSITVLLNQSVGATMVPVERVRARLEGDGEGQPKP